MSNQGELGMPSRISVIIPALDEEATIGNVVRGIPRHVADEIIVVDNGSSDDTARCARQAGAKVVSEPRRGYGRACFSGFEAVDEKCSIVVFLDGDGSDCPEHMSMVTAPIVEGNADFVIGSRARGKREPGSMNGGQLLAGWMAGWVSRIFYNVRYTDMCPFRAITRDALTKLRMTEMTYGWNLEMQFRAAQASLRILEIPVPHRLRAGGVSKVSGTLRGTFVAGTRIIATLIRVILQRRPLSALP
jgi:glycosyltransferase involved in cell wall biosynthesis